MRFTRVKHQAVEYTAYQMNRRAALMKSVFFLKLFFTKFFSGKNKRCGIEHSVPLVIAEGSARYRNVQDVALLLALLLPLFEATNAYNWQALLQYRKGSQHFEKSFFL